VAGQLLANAPARNLGPVLELLGRVTPEEARLLVDAGYLPALARNPRSLAFAGRPGSIPLLRKLVGRGGLTSPFGTNRQEVFEVLERVLRQHEGDSAEELAAVVDRLASPISELSDRELRIAMGEVDTGTKKLLAKLTDDELKLLRSPTLDEAGLAVLRSKLSDDELRRVQAALFPGETPAVWRPKSDPHIEGRKVPQGEIDPVTGEVIRPGPTRMDVEDVRLKPGETVAQGMDRVGTVIGKKISDHKAVAEVWEKARQDVLGSRNPHTDVSPEEMLRKSGIYDQVRDRFWRLLRRPENKAAGDVFRNAGFDMSGTGAPLLETTGTKPLIDEMRRISLDHMEGFEKATGSNYRFAVDATNLSFEFQYPNTLRDAIGRRLGLGSYTKPRELP
jgi:hypothetical protein